jgi:hypothetical protein
MIIYCFYVWECFYFILFYFYFLLFCPYYLSFMDVSWTNHCYIATWVAALLNFHSKGSLSAPSPPSVILAGLMSCHSKKTHHKQVKRPRSFPCDLVSVHVMHSIRHHFVPSYNNFYLTTIDHHWKHYWKTLLGPRVMILLVNY